MTNSKRKQEKEIKIVLSDKGVDYTINKVAQFCNKSMRLIHEVIAFYSPHFNCTVDFKYKNLIGY